jgi:signal transduction histidine kinase
MNDTLFFTLVVSILLQLTAAVFALRLIRQTTSVGYAWLLLASAIVLMAGRRVVTLVSYFVPGAEESFRGPIAELIALTIAVLMLLGVLRIPQVFETLRSARAAAEERRHWAEQLAKASRALLMAPLDVEERAEVLAHLAVPAFADLCFVDLVGEEAQRRYVACADPAKADAVRALPHRPLTPDGKEPDGKEPAARAMRTRRPELVPTLSEAELATMATDEEHLRMLRSLGLTSYLVVPLLVRDRKVGALSLLSMRPERRYRADDLSTAEELAHGAALALEHARLYTETQRAETALRLANEELEKRVEERTRELKEAQSRLVDTAREVGMAEVASNVLHNVGNVLTSAVINLEQMRKAVDSSRVGRFEQITTLLKDHRDDLVDFLTLDSRGKIVPDYLTALTEELLRERADLQEHLEAMGWHIEHIRSIVQMQQNYARTTLFIEECDLSQLITHAVRNQTAALQRHGIDCRCEISAQCRGRIDRHKVLQILINLITNAKQALAGVPEGQRKLLVRLTTEREEARIQVVDNGVGIAPELQEKLFAQGFTTRKDGHGRGLHFSALAANLLGGHLGLESEGPGKGVTATLVLPLTPPSTAREATSTK